MRGKPNARNGLGPKAKTTRIKQWRLSNCQTSKAERLALEFLEVFEPDRPLDQEEFEEWIQIDALSAEEVKEAAKEAVRQGWGEDTPDGLRLTDFGRRKTQG